jgi:hypothetical protein
MLQDAWCYLQSQCIFVACVVAQVSLLMQDKPPTRKSIEPVHGRLNIPQPPSAFYQEMHYMQSRSGTHIFSGIGNCVITFYSKRSFSATSIAHSHSLSLISEDVSRNAIAPDSPGLCLEQRLYSPLSGYWSVHSPVLLRNGFGIFNRMLYRRSPPFSTSLYSSP